MRTLAPQTRASPQVTHAKPATPRITLSGNAFNEGPARRAAHAIRDTPLPPGSRSGTSFAASRTASFGHDLSRVPVYARQPPAAGRPLHASGELARGSHGEMGVPVQMTGEGGTSKQTTPAPTPSAPSPAPSTPSPAPTTPTPVLRKTQIRPIRTANNGGFNWACRWSIQNATASTDGWIVQHVSLTQNVTDASGAAVEPGREPYHGLRPSWYPHWEAWQVRGGSVFVGRTATPHRADEFLQDAVGASTRGTTAITGRADFYPNLTLPINFMVLHAAPAWDLPWTITDPNLTGGTGVLSHDLTATWDGVGNTGATTVTTV